MRRSPQEVAAVVRAKARLDRLDFYPEPLREVRDWMRMYEKFWTRRLEGLGAYLDKHHR